MPYGPFPAGLLGTGRSFDATNGSRTAGLAFVFSGIESCWIRPGLLQPSTGGEKKLAHQRALGMRAQAMVPLVEGLLAVGELRCLMKSSSHATRGHVLDQKGQPRLIGERSFQMSRNMVSRVGIAAIAGILGSLLFACGSNSNTGGVSGAATSQPAASAGSPVTPTPAAPSASPSSVIATPPVEFTVSPGTESTEPFHISSAPWKVTLSIQSQQCSTAQAVVRVHSYGEAGRVVKNIDEEGCDSEIETINVMGDFYLEITATNAQVHVVVTGQ